MKNFGIKDVKRKIFLTKSRKYAIIIIENKKKWEEEEKASHFKVSQSFTHLNEISLIGEVDTFLSPYAYLSFSPNFDGIVYIHK